MEISEEKLSLDNITDCDCSFIFTNTNLSFLLQPFGEGLVTVTVPQLHRRENSLSLWNILDINSPVVSPVNTFVGHSDVVLEFQWRSQRLDGELL